MRARTPACLVSDHNPEEPVTFTAQLIASRAPHAAPEIYCENYEGEIGPGSNDAWPLTQNTRCT